MELKKVETRFAKTSDRAVAVTISLGAVNMAAELL